MSIFKTQPISGGHTWSITTKLGHIIKIAETLYGKRDASYTLLGVELTKKKNPQIWFPNYGDSKNIVIQITENCLNDMDRAVFQVAHEAIHCLAPVKNNEVSVLEEGLATLFAIDYCTKNNHGKHWNAQKKEYVTAQKWVEKLIETDKHIIKKLRDLEPSFSKINKSLILKINPNVPEFLITALTKPFYTNPSPDFT